MLNKNLTFSIILIFLSILNLNVNAIYFHIRETESKCFIEEVPEDTMIVGKYKTEIFDKSKNVYVPTVSGLGMHVEITDPEKKVVLSRTYSSEGRFVHTTHSSGEFSICIHSNSSVWFGGAKLRVHLEIQTGEHAQDYKEIAAKDKLTDLQLRVRQLIDQVEQITKEQNYQRDREARFRDTSESTNSRVLYFSLIQVGLLVIVGFWQMQNLKSFFRAKKLV